jgi:4'-phosphopantetheinyl transferase
LAKERHGMSFFTRSQPLSLSPFEEAHFWAIDLRAIQQEEVEEAQKFLDDETLNRTEKLIFESDRNRLVIVHAILRIHLEKFTQKKPEILRDAFGKPYLKNQALHFNISHKKHYALLGFHPHHPIGVDIEQLESSSSNDFFDEWCATEAFLKAKGTGFLCAPPPIEKKFSGCFVSQGCDIYVYDGLIESHKLAVCLAR